MKKNHGLLWLFVAFMSASLFFVSCKDDDDPEEKEKYIYTPSALAVSLTDANEASFTWNDNTATDADHYVFELYKGTSEAGTLVIDEDIDVATMAYDYSEALYSGIEYFARVKGAAAADDLETEDSDWATLSFTATLLDLSEDFQDGDVNATEVTIRWTAGSTATSIVYTDGETEKTYEVSSTDVTNGYATITGLTENTSYTAKLYNGEGVIGEYAFMTDIEGGVSVISDAELATAITNAIDGDIIVLETTETDTYTLTDATISANITIRGRNESSIPTVKLSLTMAESFGGLELMYLNIDGNSEIDNMISLAAHADDCDAAIFQNWGSQFVGGDISIVDCEIHNYNWHILNAPNESYQTVANYTIEGCIIGNVGGALVKTRLWSSPGYCSIGDGNPFRGSAVLNTVVNNSTLYNVATASETGLFTLGDTQWSLSGVESTITLTNSTVYNVSPNYMIFNTTYGKLDTEGEVTVSNCLFAEITDCVTSNSSQVQNALLFESNEYSNAASLIIDGDYTKKNSKTLFDTAGSEVTATFTDAANGDFTVTGATVGDPRWLQ